APRGPFADSTGVVLAQGVPARPLTPMEWSPVTQSAYVLGVGGQVYSVNGTTGESRVLQEGVTDIGMTGDGRGLLFLLPRPGGAQDLLERFVSTGSVDTVAINVISFLAGPGGTTAIYARPGPRVDSLFLGETRPPAFAPVGNGVPPGLGISTDGRYACWQD